MKNKVKDISHLGEEYKRFSKVEDAPKAVTTTFHGAADKFDFKLNQLEVIGKPGQIWPTQVLFDGKPLAATKVVITIEAGKAHEATVTYYPEKEDK